MPPPRIRPSRPPVPSPLRGGGLGRGGRAPQRSPPLPDPPPLRGEGEEPPGRTTPLGGAGRHTAAGFSSRNEPITSASSGDVQKLSTASRGVQTIGSPRVLNDVFTSTGTPVRRWNALIR